MSPNSALFLVLGLSLFQIHGCGGGGSDDDADGDSGPVECTQSAMLSCQMKAGAVMVDPNTATEEEIQAASCAMVAGSVACFESCDCDATFEEIGQDCGGADSPACDQKVANFLRITEIMGARMCPDTDLSSHCSDDDDEDASSPVDER
jgi:hypothetical protein